MNIPKEDLIVLKDKYGDVYSQSFGGAIIIKNKEKYGLLDERNYKMLLPFQKNKIERVGECLQIVSESGVRELCRYVSGKKVTISNSVNGFHYLGNGFYANSISSSFDKYIIIDARDPQNPLEVRQCSFFNKFKFNRCLIKAYDEHVIINQYGDTVFTVTNKDFDNKDGFISHNGDEYSNVGLIEFYLNVGTKTVESYFFDRFGNKYKSKEDFIYDIINTGSLRKLPIEYIDSQEFKEEIKTYLEELKEKAKEKKSLKETEELKRRAVILKHCVEEVKTLIRNYRAVLVESMKEQEKKEEELAKKREPELTRLKREMEEKESCDNEISDILNNININYSF